MCNCKKKPDPTPPPIPEEVKDQFIVEPSEMDDLPQIHIDINSDSTDSYE